VRDTCLKPPGTRDGNASPKKHRSGVEAVAIAARLFGRGTIWRRLHALVARSCVTGAY
jgi:hypothetical protein